MAMVERPFGNELPNTPSSPSADGQRRSRETADMPGGNGSQTPHLGTRDRALGDGQDLAGQLGSLAEDARSHALEAATPIKEKAREVAQDQKNFVADRIGGIARAMDRMAADFERESPATSDLIRSAAGSVRSASQQLRDRNVDELTESVSRFARNQPMTVFAGAVVAGLALSRFLKSSSHPGR